MSRFVVDFSWRGVKLRFVTNYLKARELVKSPEFLQMGFAGPKLSTHGSVDATFRFKHVARGPKLISFDRHQRRLSLQCSWRDIHPSSEHMGTIDELIAVLCEYSNQKRSQFCIHASAVEKYGRTIVMTGSRYSGKTTLALEMCLHHHCRLISSDHTVVGYDQSNNPAILDGERRTIKVRPASLRASNPELFQRILEWKNRKNPPLVSVLPTEMGIDTYLSSMPLRMDIITLVSVDGSFKARIEPVSDEAEIQSFAEQFTKWIRGAPITILDRHQRIASLPFPILDSDNLHRNRAKFINQLLDERRVFTLRGDLKGCSRILARIIDCPDGFRNAAVPMRRLDHPWNRNQLKI